MFLVTNENMGLCLNMHSIQNVLLSFQDRDFGNDSEPEPECSFRDKESQMTGSTCQSVCPSRASVDSHKSISFFIDLVSQKIISIFLLVLLFYVNGFFLHQKKLTCMLTLVVGLIVL